MNFFRDMIRLFFLLFFHITYCHSQEIITQYICYSVPIDISVLADNYGYINKENNITGDEEVNLLNKRLSKDNIGILMSTIFDRVRSGNVTAYVPDEYSNTSIKYESPDKYFNTPINTKNLDDFLSQITRKKLIDEYGDPLYDEYGDYLFEDVLNPYKADDFAGITFYENWSVNTNSNILEKKVVGYTIDVKNYKFDNDKVYFIGLKPVIYIRCKPNLKSDDIIKLAENIETKTKIKRTRIDGVNSLSLIYQVESINRDVWWENNLLPNISTPFLGKIISAIKYDGLDFEDARNLKQDIEVYEAVFPYNKQINKFKKDATIDYMTKLDDNGDVIYDDNGDKILESKYSIIKPNLIKSLGFLENWSFDTMSLSIQKEVMGVIPYKLMFDSDTGRMLGDAAMYYVKFKD